MMDLHVHAVSEMFFAVGTQILHADHLATVSWTCIDYQFKQCSYCCLHQNVKDYKRDQGGTAVKAVTFIEGETCLQITMLHTWHGSQQCPDLAFHRLTTYSPSIRKKEKKTLKGGKHYFAIMFTNPNGGFDQKIYAWPLGKTHVDFSAPYTNLYWETIFE